MMWNFSEGGGSAECYCKVGLLMVILSRFLVFCFFLYGGLVPSAHSLTYSLTREDEDGESVGEGTRGRGERRNGTALWIER